MVASGEGHLSCVQMLLAAEAAVDQPSKVLTLHGMS
jgi:hypothetical protein